MAIVESQGATYVVGVGEKVGDATVVAISADGVVFKQAGSTYTVTIRGDHTSSLPSAPAIPAAKSSDSVPPPLVGTAPPARRAPPPVAAPPNAGPRAAAPPPVAIAADTPQSYRVAIGPLYDRARADAIVDRLTRAGFAPRMTMDGQDRREGYRVVSPPLPILTAEHRVAGLSDLHPTTEPVADGTVRVVFDVATSEQAASLVTEIRVRGYAGMVVEPTGPTYTITLNSAGKDGADKIVAVVKEVEPEAPLTVGSSP